MNIYFTKATTVLIESIKNEFKVSIFNLNSFIE